MAVVCIAGMHRSGTSMITRLLNLSGFYLGDEKDLIGASNDNTEGFWENSKFVELNDEILSVLGGGWDYPPIFNDRWESQPELLYLRVKAAKLLANFEKQDRWAWKDPRNSILLPFWKQFFPNMKVVICVRNPFDVYSSLRKRNYFSPASSFNLWLKYYEILLSSVSPENRLITHYDVYFHDPIAELGRVLKFLEVPYSESLIQSYTKFISLGLRHSSASVVDLLSANPPMALLELYDKMCAEAGQVYHAMPQQVLIEKDIDFNDANYVEYLLRKQKAALEAKIAQKEEELREIKLTIKGKEWQLVMCLRKIRFFLFPSGSVQEKIIQSFLRKTG